MIEQNCLEKMILKPRLFPDAEQAQWRGVPCGNRVAKSNLNNTDTNFNQKGMPTGGETKRQKDTLMIKYLLPVLTSRDC